ncbi:MAG: hypothetical protein MPW15_26905 [Candidatus Manganitrophus sp.]|nr:hypothetical protein [Candidatus Manganitrophus sp.]
MVILWKLSCRLEGESCSCNANDTDYEFEIIRYKKEIVIHYKTKFFTAIAEVIGSVIEGRDFHGGYFWAGRHPLMQRAGDAPPQDNWGER